MALRNIIEIDEELCDGCGLCVPSCVEGALKIIDGKARLVSDVLCDGLGACLGECPTGALTVIQREAPDFDEVAAGMHQHPPATPPRAAPRPVAAPVAVPLAAVAVGGGCPGSRVQVFDDQPAPRPAPRIIPMQDRSPAGPAAQSEPLGLASGSRLRQWPVQLHLVPPTAPFFRGREVLLAADCVPVAVADFHTAFLDGRGLAIACPKLDEHQDAYVRKLTSMIDDGQITALTVVVMEVPCCAGLVRLAEQALAAARRDVPLQLVTVGIRGTIVSAGCA